MGRIGRTLGLAGLCLLFTMNGFAGAADAGGGTPRSTDDFIRALTPGTPVGGGKITLRGLTLGTGDVVGGGTPAPAPGLAPASAPQPPEAPRPAPVQSPPSAPPRIAFQVNFEFNSAKLSPEATTILDALGRALASPALSGYRFQLAGHTDGVGNPQRNRELSKKRALSVRDYLSRNFPVAAGRLVAVGRGSDQLLDAANPASDANRRVEVINLGF